MHLGMEERPVPFSGHCDIYVVFHFFDTVALTSDLVFRIIVSDQI